MGLLPHKIDLAVALADPRIPLPEKLHLYLKTCRNPEYGEPWQFTAWQIADIARFIYAPRNCELMLLRNRGGSKTRDLTVIATFLAYQQNEFGSKNRIVWFSGTESQLEAVSGYFHENRYINTKKSSALRIHLLNKNVIQLRPLTRKQAKSPRADVLFYDEEQDMDEMPFMESLGTLAGGSHKIIHAGTTQIGSLLEQTYHKLKPLGKVSQHIITDCTWHRLEESLAKYSQFPEWIVRSQLYCEWVRPGGIVFRSFQKVHPSTFPVFDHKYTRCLGLDANPVFGYAITETATKDKTIYVVRTHPLVQDPFVCAQYLATLLYNNPEMYLQVEENAGEEFLKILFRTFSEMHVSKSRIYTRRWSADTKFQDVSAVSMYHIIANELESDLCMRIESSAWDDKKSDGSIPVIIKNEKDHFFDGFVHSGSLGTRVKFGVKFVDRSRFDR